LISEKYLTQLCDSDDAALDSEVNSDFKRMNDMTGPEMIAIANQMADEEDGNGFWCV
jgi:hypothetical protein